MISRNKRTLGLYLGDPDGARIFKQLARTADVIVENFRPGTLGAGARLRRPLR